jgi:arylsulfatase A-like enzyme
MQAISQAPSTASAHMSLFTGLQPTIHRVTNRMVDPEIYRRMGLGLATSIPTLSQYLKENGYLTAGFHGGGNVSAILGFDRGFDLYEKTPWEKLYNDPAPLNKVNKRLGQKIVREKPFFLFVHNYICHDPYLQAPPEFRRRFLTTPVPGLQEELEKITPEGMTTTQRFHSKRRQWWSLIDGTNENHRRHISSLYDAGVNYADFVLGKFLDSLKRKGLYDRSLIIVTSDHGEQF